MSDSGVRVTTSVITDVAERAREAVEYLISLRVEYFGAGSAELGDLGSRATSAIEELAVLMGVQPVPITDAMERRWGNGGADPGQLFEWQRMLGGRAGEAK